LDRERDLDLLLPSRLLDLDLERERDLERDRDLDRSDPERLLDLDLLRERLRERRLSSLIFSFFPSSSKSF
jgi:hypothetical protein